MRPGRLPASPENDSSLLRIIIGECRRPPPSEASGEPVLRRRGEVRGGRGRSSAPEVFLDDPRGLPPVRLTLEVVEPDLLRLRGLHRERLLVADLLLPG